MAKYIVKKQYRDLELGRILTPGEDVEMTVKRAEEVAKSLKDRGHGDTYLERVTEKAKKKAKVEEEEKEEK